MITDKKNTFASKVAAFSGVVGGGAVQVGDVLDLGAEYDAGIGNPLKVTIIVTTVYGAGTSQDFRVETGTDDGADDKVVASTGAILVASLVAGLKKEMAVSGLSRYVRVTRLPGAVASTSGIVSAVIGPR